MAKRRGIKGKVTRSGLISRRSLLGAAAMAFATSRAHGQSAPSMRRRIGVIYAHSDRFAPILDATLSGLAEAAPFWEFDHKRLRPGITAAAIEEWFDGAVSGLILLGTEAKDIVKAMRIRKPAVTGLQYISPVDEIADGGVSLDFDPEDVLPELAALLPRHNRIHALYVDGRDDWIIERLRQAGAMRGYAVLPAAADSLSEATDHFSGALRYANPATDIIWVLGGSGLLTGDTAGHLFQQAYNGRFPVFTNRRAWVNEGAFLGGEPDFHAHGAQIARVMDKILATGKRRFETASRISFAMNVRVARRVGVDVSQAVRDRMGALVADD